MRRPETVGIGSHFPCLSSFDSCVEGDAFVSVSVAKLTSLSPSGLKEILMISWITVGIVGSDS